MAKKRKKMQSGGRVSSGSAKSLFANLTTTAMKKALAHKEALEKKGIKFVKPPQQRTASPGVTSKEGSTSTSRVRFDPKTGRRIDDTSTSGTSTGANIDNPGGSSKVGLGAAARQEAARKKKKNQMQRGGRVKPKVRKKRR